MASTLEQKRASSRGVYYDKRIAKYTAQIRIAGKRFYLGAFDSEDDAAAAHALARHDNPIRRGGSGGGLTFTETYDIFLEQQAAVTGQPKGVLQAEAEFFAPSGQRYFLVLVETVLHPTIAKAKWVYYRWLSKCSECGVDFITSTRYGRKVERGMTRTCAKHRKDGPRLDEPIVHATVMKAVNKGREKQQQADDDLEEITEAVYQRSLLPGSTRADLKRVHDETKAKIDARRAAQDDTLV